MSIGFPQVLIILVLVLVVFGAGKLPKVMGDLGKGMKNFKDGLNEAEAKKSIEEPELKSAIAEDSKNSKQEV